ncbi:MAG: UDP-N-acetylmuramate--L-alanine ligase [Ruminococcaceae bacterium]|nr:UDP-N-acetylmuramate--L-alanine ligase [Oscillospiraceae bacterium]
MPAICDLSKMKNVYFAGIGGISMSSLALILKNRGILVSGYDFKESETTKMLTEKGIKIDYTYDNAVFPEADTVVYTAALGQDDPILVRARDRGLDIFTRAELLGAITGDYKHSVGVAGTHGKSSTTGFLAEICLAANNDSTILAGAVMPSVGSTYTVGNGDCAVFEACEYKNSYHSMYPTIKTILNVELDHVDFFGNLENVIESFRKYISKPGKNGENIAVINLDNENAVKAAENTDADIRYFSIKDKTDYYAQNIDLSDGYGEFDVIKKETLLCHVKLSIPGIHNVANAVAAAASADLCGIDKAAIKKGLESFIGVKRRFEKVKKLDSGAIVIDDYAHHPDEITVTLNSAKKVAKGKVICIFQPHTYSRTKALFNDFVKALSIADKVLMAPIYAARETDTLGVSSDDVAKKIENAESLYSFESLRERATELAEKGDLVITMGAGDVYKVFQK